MNKQNTHSEKDFIMKDTVTKIFIKVLNILFLYNIVGTTFGCLVGFLALSFQEAFALYFPLIGKIKWYGFISLGVLLFNIPPLVKKRYMDPEIEKRLKYTREILKEGAFTDKEKKLHWRRLMNTILKEWSEDTANTEHNDSDNGVAD